MTVSPQKKALDTQNSIALDALLNSFNQGGAATSKQRTTILSMFDMPTDTPSFIATGHTYRDELEEWAFEHAGGVGECDEEVKELLSEMTTKQIERRLLRMGYSINEIKQSYKEAI